MRVFFAVPVLATLFGATVFAANRYHCVGTEPFWSADVSEKTVIVSSPGEERETLLIAQRSYPQGTAPSFGEVIRAGKPGVDATLTIRSDSKCNDGMSEQTYTHEIWFLRNNTLVVGCCR